MEVGAVELLMYETIVVISQHERDNNLRLLNYTTIIYSMTIYWNK